MRGDMICFHEPFGEAWYQGDDAKWPRLDDNSPRKTGLTFESVMNNLVNASKKKPVFSKDMPQFTDHLWSTDFFNRFKHSFIIRDPAKVLTSCHRNWSEFYNNEIGFNQQRELFDRLSDQFGKAPPIIDSDDLLSNPHAMVEKYCEAVDIAFIESVLSWKPVERSEVLWYDTEGVWHENLKKSDGLKPQPVKPADISKTPHWVQDMYKEFLPHYEYMLQFRIKI